MHEDIEGSALSMVAPVKDDQVLVVRGQEQGTVCKLVSVSQKDEGIIQTSHEEIKIVKMSNLAKVGKL